MHRSPASLSRAVRATGSIARGSNPSALSFSFFSSLSSLFYAHISAVGAGATVELVGGPLAQLPHARSTEGPTPAVSSHAFHTHGRGSPAAGPLLWLPPTRGELLGGSRTHAPGERRRRLACTAPRPPAAWSSAAPARTRWHCGQRASPSLSQSAKQG
ncbi:hypothetical protein C2845_PM05G30070 [Panicum miliaceum]|uniref:Uncharacterized protein n=1 Tax=Panicum miliaceum TaxID=4540 RepID=A0A3L6SUR9_PANMI|nr:hypothetical protein C2845_PM05G30070 [Panicum miliaceum]